MNTVKITIPASAVVDALSGRRPLAGQYGSGDGWFDQQLARYLSGGWAIVGCAFKVGDIEQGLAGTVEFELTAPHDPVFWGNSDKR